MKRNSLGIGLVIWGFHFIGILILQQVFFLPLEVIPLHLSIVFLIHWFSFWVLKLMGFSKFETALTKLYFFLYFLLFALVYILNYLSLSEWGNYISYKTLMIISQSRNELTSNFSSDILYMGILILVIGMISYIIAGFSIVRLRPFRVSTKKGFILSCIALILMFALVQDFKNYRLRLKFKGEPLYNFISPALFSFDDQKIDFKYDDRITDFETKLIEQKQSSYPNIILIVVDALRYDRLSVNDYFRKTSPFLDSLASVDHFVSLPQMRSSCSTSFCGILSILSGVPIYDLGPSAYKINDALKTLDYRCHFLLSGAHNDWYQLRRAYEFYHKLDVYHEGTFNDSLGVSDDLALLHQLDKLELKNRRNNFIYLHMMSSHRAGNKYKSLHKYFPDGPLNYFDPDSLLYANHYDNGVVQTDYLIQEIFSILDKKQIAEDCMVFITADHGEALGEHGRFGHAGNVSEANIRIPFLYYSKKYPFLLNTDLNYSHVDIAPIILGQITDPDFENIWLSSDESRFSYHQQGYHYAVVYREGDQIFKLWYNEKSGNSKLFDLNADPYEKENIISKMENKAIANLLAEELKQKFELLK